MASLPTTIKIKYRAIETAIKVRLLRIYSTLGYLLKMFAGSGFILVAD